MLNKLATGFIIESQYLIVQLTDDVKKILRIEIFPIRIAWLIWQTTDNSIEVVIFGNKFPDSNRQFDFWMERFYLFHFGSQPNQAGQFQ